MQILAAIGQLACTVHGKVAVGSKLGMHAEVLQVGIRDQFSDGVGHAADAELDCRTIADVREDMRGDLPFEIACGRRGHFPEGKCRTFHYGVHFGKRQFGRFAADARHGGVDFNNQVLCNIRNRPGYPDDA